MYGVYAPNAETLRKVLDRPNRLLGYPFCAYLIYLARSVDAAALRFLEEFGAALDLETGEAIAFIVLLDETTLSGTNDPTGLVHKRGWEQQQRRREQEVEILGENEHADWPRYADSSLPQSNYDDFPLVDIPELVDGGHEFERAVSRRIKENAIPGQAYYRSSPEWSLKFADHLGLSRNHLPCVVAFDDPGASDDESCIIVPLDNPKDAWDSIVHAISNFVMRTDAQAFIRAAERVREIETELKDSTARLNNIEYRLSRLKRAIAEGRDTTSERPSSDWPLQEATLLRNGFPSQPTELLAWISSLSSGSRSFLMDAAAIAQDNGYDVNPLLTMMENLAEFLEAREYQRTIRRLRSRWLRASDSEDNPHIKSMLRNQVKEALVWLGRPVEDLDSVLVMNVSDRERFVEALEAHALSREPELHQAWTVLNEAVGPNLISAVGSRKVEHLQAAIEAARQSVVVLSSRHRKAMTELNSVKKSPFLPDLAQSVGQTMNRNQPHVREAGSVRKRIVRGATISAEGAGFLASIVQILQGIGVLR